MIIEKEAFRTNHLKYFKIPDSVTSIKRYAFSDNMDLIQVIIPNSVTEIEDYAFYETSLVKITIPSRFKNRIEEIFGFNRSRGQYVNQFMEKYSEYHTIPVVKFIFTDDNNPTPVSNTPDVSNDDYLKPPPEEDDNEPPPPSYQNPPP